MSFKANGVKTRPEREKPLPTASASSPTAANPQPPSWSRSRSRRSSTSSADSFHSARFPLDEETRMVSASHDIKAQANTQFARQDYSSAIGTYDRALAELPTYLDYEIAVLQSNIAACHLKLEQWKEAVDSCERGLHGLERELPTQTKRKAAGTTARGPDKASHRTKTTAVAAPGSSAVRPETLNSDTESEPGSPQRNSADDTVVELSSDADEASTLAALESLRLSDARKSDIHRIRTKLLLRRARARSQMLPPAWANLSAALEDYRTLSGAEYFATLPPPDQRTVRQALVTLPPRVDEAKQKEVGEMMGKLKDLGNGILKPFGLSTDNFKVVQGEGGGYSLSFDGAGGKEKT